MDAIQKYSKNEKMRDLLAVAGIVATVVGATVSILMLRKLLRDEKEYKAKNNNNNDNQNPQT